jgi:hypothetical protein
VVAAPPVFTAVSVLLVRLVGTAGHLVRDILCDIRQTIGQRLYGSAARLGLGRNAIRHPGNLVSQRLHRIAPRLRFVAVQRDQLFHLLQQDLHRRRLGIDPLCRFDAPDQVNRRPLCRRRLHTGARASVAAMLL